MQHKVGGAENTASPFISIMLLRTQASALQQVTLIVNASCSLSNGAQLFDNGL